MANINKIILSGQTYDIQDPNASKTVELTQAEYDALETKDANTFYIITDAEAGNLSNYYTKSETSGATEISTALASKADTATTYTKTETDNAITAATSTKQDTLVSGTNIKTINGETLLGEGNITIEGGGGGGKAIEAGTNISITTGETADTINCTLPLTVGRGSRSLKNTLFGDSIGEASFAMGNGSVTSKGNSSFAFGSNVTVDGYGSFGAGINVNTYSNYAAVFGLLNDASGLTEFACGQNCLSRVVDNSFKGFGNSGNTQFIVGNGKQNAGRHNAFEVRQSGDIYIVDTNDTSTSNYWEKPMIRLQDYLGGGGSSYTAGDGIDITNDVISVTGKVDTSAFTAHTADTVIHVTSDEKAAWNGKQDTLVSGTNIKTINNESILGEGNITIEGGGGSSITIDPSLDSGSTNAVANSAITTALNAKSDKGNFNSFLFTSMNGNPGVMFKKDDGGSKNLWFSKINGTKVFEISSIYQATNFSLVETSAITTSVTSSSTDSQVPSAKAVNDKLGGLKLVKLTQSEYDSLSTKDNSTLYVIVN